MQALRAAVRADKKAYVASVLALTPAEAKKFWPAYDAYQRTLDMTNREKNVTIMGVIGQNKPVSDLYAKQIAKDIIVADEVETKARRTLYNRVMRALPPTESGALSAARGQDPRRPGLRHRRGDPADQVEGRAGRAGPGAESAVFFAFSGGRH